METKKQKFTVEFEYPVADASVNIYEMRKILYEGLKCFGWDIKVTEEEV